MITREMLNMINYEFLQRKVNEAIDEFTNSKFCVFGISTPHGCRTTAVSHMITRCCDGYHIFFTTSNKSEKYTDLMSDCGVVSFTTVGKMGINLEADFVTAKNIPSIINTEEWEKFKNKQPDTVEKYSELDGEVFTNFIIRRINFWHYVPEFGGEPIIINIDDLDSLSGDIRDSAGDTIFEFTFIKKMTEERS